MRLFIAVPITADVCKQLAEHTESLRLDGCRGNFTPPDNMHITLAFIGESTRVDDIIDIIEQSAGDSFEIRTGKPGFFSDTFIVPIATSPPLTALSRRINNKLKDSGFGIENRPFRPHITLARRFVSPNGYFIAPLDSITINVNHISLMLSERGEHHMIYTELYGLNLEKSC